MGQHVADLLDYGALGLVAIILVLVGMAVREALTRWQDREKTKLQLQADTEKQQLAIEAERAAAADRFLRELIAKDREQRNEHITALQSLVSEDIEAKQALTLAIQELCQRSDQHEARANERHRVLMHLFEEHESGTA